MGRLKSQIFELREGLRVSIHPGGLDFSYVDVLIEEKTIDGRWIALALGGDFQLDTDDFLRFLDTMERVKKLMVLQ